MVAINRKSLFKLIRLGFFSFFYYFCFFSVFRFFCFLTGVRKIAPEENYPPPRLGLDFGLALGLRLGLRGNFSRGQLSQNRI